ncbi:TIGR02300 family protein [Albimonas sp. CAU 1670]|uniref:TIGR02300 family protein n=1 Tax=Albimonas sp. CAU 1670 TaxID=3032599 RepID=UPI0023DB1702|nr:TIGR02300 family protein [Albimonas sp. CAU 1670]MDF2231908.1 TIGR02300 family protein [Albimonas sp. CAU 1670]
MAKPEWGAKRVCPSCQTRFYDLMRDPAPCPSCGASFDLAQLSERKGPTMTRAKPKPEKAAAEDAPVLEDDDLLDDDDDSNADDDVLLEDDDDDSDDDIGIVGGGDKDDEES